MVYGIYIMFKIWNQKKNRKGKVSRWGARRTLKKANWTLNTDEINKNPAGITRKLTITASNIIFLLHKNKIVLNIQKSVFENEISMKNWIKSQSLETNPKGTFC